MYIIAIESHFSGAHQVKGYDGSCDNLHGHNWKVKAEIVSEKPDKIGICFDFKELKQITNSVIDNLDHTYLNEIKPFDKANPTAENIAKYFYDQIKAKLPQNVKISQVTIWESEKYSVTYRED